MEYCHIGMVDKQFGPSTFARNSPSAMKKEVIQVLAFPIQDITSYTSSLAQ